MPIWSPYTMGHLKRKAEDDMGPDAKGAKAGGAGGGAAGSADVAALVPMIPRHVGLWSHSIELVCNSFEEIGNSLAYLPLCMSPRRFMVANRNQNAKLISQWRPISTGWKVKSCSAGINNILFLQDALTGGGTTPETTTAPSQSAYLVVIRPPPTSGHSICLGQGTAGAFTPIALSVDEIFGGAGNEEYGTNQLIEITSDVDIEKLRWREFNLNLAGNAMTQNGPDGFLHTVQQSRNQINKDSGAVTIAPADAQLGASIDQILGPAEVFEQSCSTVLNRSSTQFVKLGGSISIPICTNMNNAIFKSSSATRDPTPTATTASGSVIYSTYNNMEQRMELTEKSAYAFFGWPCKVNPFWSRSNCWWYGGLVSALNKMGPLCHTFVQMAPMKDAEGNLVKQRASCTLEQRMVVEFFFRDDLDNDGGIVIAGDSTLGQVWDQAADIPDTNAKGWINNWSKAEVHARPYVCNKTSTTLSTFYL